MAQYLPKLIFAALCIACATQAQISIQSTAAVQVTKNCSAASTANIDNSFVRGEIKASAAPTDKTGGLVQLRFELPVAGQTVDLKQVLQQAYWDLDISKITLRGGRWYSTYSPGAYFGRYLFGVNGLGSGAMCVNYTAIDGAMLSAKLDQLKTNLSLAVLPQDFQGENVYTMALIESNPFEQLSVKLGGNFQVVTPNDTDTKHRLMLAATYTVIKDLNIFAEGATVDISHAQDNAYLLAGLDIPAARILDELRVEIEYKKDRLSPGNTDADVAWMLVLVKKVRGLGFYVDVGADPAQLGSRGAGDIGGNARISASF